MLPNAAGWAGAAATAEGTGFARAGGGGGSSSASESLLSSAAGTAAGGGGCGEAGCGGGVDCGFGCDGGGGGCESAICSAVGRGGGGGGGRSISSSMSACKRQTERERRQSSGRGRHSGQPTLPLQRTICPHPQRCIQRRGVHTALCVLIRIDCLRSCVRDETNHGVAVRCRRVTGRVDARVLQPSGAVPVAVSSVVRVRGQRCVTEFVNGSIAICLCFCLLRCLLLSRWPRLSRRRSVFRSGSKGREGAKEGKRKQNKTKPNQTKPSGRPNNDRGRGRGGMERGRGQRRRTVAGAHPCAHASSPRVQMAVNGSRCGEAAAGALLRTQAGAERRANRPPTATHHQPTTTAIRAHNRSPHLAVFVSRTQAHSATAHSPSAHPPLPVGPPRTGAAAGVTPLLFFFVRPPAPIPTSSWWWRCD